MEQNNSVFIIYYFGILHVGHLNAFMENISSNYPHKKVSSSGILIYTNDNTVEIFNKITSNNTIPGNVMVIELTTWWGKFPTEVADWIKSKGVKIKSAE